MGDSGRELAEGVQLFSLDELQLSGIEFALQEVKLPLAGCKFVLQQDPALVVDECTDEEGRPLVTLEVVMRVADTNTLPRGFFVNGTWRNDNGWR